MTELEKAREELQQALGVIGELLHVEITAVSPTDGERVLLCSMPTWVLRVLLAATEPVPPGDLAEAVRILNEMARELDREAVSVPDCAGSNHDARGCHREAKAIRTVLAELERLQETDVQFSVRKRVRYRPTGEMGTVVDVSITGYQVHVRMDDGRLLPHRPESDFEEVPADAR